MSDYIFKIPKIQAPFFAFQNGVSGPLSNQFIIIVRISGGLSSQIQKTEDTVFFQIKRQNKKSGGKRKCCVDENRNISLHK
jgi:hypothetical protein